MTTYALRQRWVNVWQVPERGGRGDVPGWVYNLLLDGGQVAIVEGKLLVNGQPDPSPGSWLISFLGRVIVVSNEYFKLNFEAMPEVASDHRIL